ncbi:MAG: SIMPL domain-containing protein [Candidatus Micrarchaeales archaeon]
MAKSDAGNNAAIVLSIVAIASVIVLLILGCHGFGGAQTITVTATGTAYGFSDQALMYIFANSTGDTAALANSGLVSTVNSVDNALAPYLNGNSSLIQTQSYNVFQTRILVCTGASGVVVSGPCLNRTGYEAAQSIVATIPNILNVSGAIAALAAIPNVNVQGVNQQLSAMQYSRLLNNSLSNAVVNATAQAQALAGSKYTVSIINITTTQSSPIFYGPLAAASSGSAQNSSYFVGRTGVTRSITVVFRMNRR